MIVKLQDPDVAVHFLELKRSKDAYSSPVAESIIINIQKVILQSGSVDPLNPEQ